jgi:hypothetical protein
MLYQLNTCTEWTILNYLLKTLHVCSHWRTRSQHVWQFLVAETVVWVLLTPNPAICHNPLSPVCAQCFPDNYFILTIRFHRFSKDFLTKNLYKSPVSKSQPYLVRISSNVSCVVSGFRRDVDEICALLGCYAASSGNPLPTFRDNVSVPSSRVNKSKKKAKKKGFFSCTQRSVTILYRRFGRRNRSHFQGSTSPREKPRRKLFFLDLMTVEDRTEWLSRNVRTELSLNGA